MLQLWLVTVYGLVGIRTLTIYRLLRLDRPGGLLLISTSVTICDCSWRKFQCEHKILPMLVQMTFEAVYG